MAITPHLERGDYLRRQLSAILLMVSSLLAIALTFEHVRIALWAPTLNFAGPMIRVWSKRAAALD